MESKNIYRVIFVFTIIMSLILTLSAQQGRGKGRIRGTTRDEAGNTIEGVRIIAQHLKFTTTFKSESGRKGNWAIAGLGTGIYKITASKEGYETISLEVKFSQFSGKNPKINLILKKIQTMIFFEEGNQLYRQKKYAEAVVVFKEFLEKNPSVYQVIINIGNCYREMGEYDKAIAEYIKVLDRLNIDKDSFEGDEIAARALVSISEAHIKQGNLEIAREYLMQAVEISKEDEVLTFNIGEIYFDQGEIEKAIEYFKIAININSTWAHPYRQLGYAYMNKGEYKLALDSMTKFLELAPDDPRAESIRNLIPKLEELIKKENQG